MFDLETLDTLPSTVILSIGAVEFDPASGKVDEAGGKLWFPNVQDQIQAGRTMSWDTIEWWMKQSDAARKELIGARRTPFQETLETVRKWMSFIPEPCVWGNGSIFDIAILEHAMNYESIPWKFFNIYDTRTLWLVHPYDREKKGETKHTALDDAITQARRVCEVWPK